MPNNNRIPRKATKIKAKWKLGNMIHIFGNVSDCFKDDNGWHAVGKDGVEYFVFADYLRNGELCEFLEVT